MKGSVKIAAALVAVVAMLACEGEDEGRVKSDRPPNEKVVDESKARKATVEVHGTGPYEVFVHVAEERGGSGSDQYRDKIAGGTFKQDVDYTSGVRLRIRVNVTGHENDKFTCKIIDGPLAVEHRGPNPGKVYCAATTTG